MQAKNSRPVGVVLDAKATNVTTLMAGNTTAEHVKRLCDLVTRELLLCPELQLISSNPMTSSHGLKEVSDRLDT